MTPVNLYTCGYILNVTLCKGVRNRPDFWAMCQDSSKFIIGFVLHDNVLYIKDVCTLSYIYTPTNCSLPKGYREVCIDNTGNVCCRSSQIDHMKIAHI